VLRGAKAITMKGDEVIVDADIVVTDNRIAAIGKRGSVTIPANAKIQDVKGATIMRGSWTCTRTGSRWRAGSSICRTGR
jgi:imidazolonepropionase-like amidohydrolase